MKDGRNMREGWKMGETCETWKTCEKHERNMRETWKMGLMGETWETCKKHKKNLRETWGKLKEISV